MIRFVSNLCGSHRSAYAVFAYSILAAWVWFVANKVVLYVATKVA